MSGELNDKHSEECQVLFPHLEGIDNKMLKMYNKGNNGIKDDVTFVYTTKFSNLCNDNKDGDKYAKGNERKKIKDKKEKKKTLHSHKKSCALPGVPTFEDFFGENIGNTSKCMAPHLRKRINEIIVRKNENECYNSNDNNNNNNNKSEYTNIKEHKYNNNEQRNRKENSMNHRNNKSKPKDADVRMKEMETFLGKHFPTKNSHSHNYNSNNSNNNGISKLKAPINTKCKYIQEVNPHVNMYDDVRLFGKSTSCQKIDHLNRLLNVQWKNGVPIQHNEYSSSYNNTNTNGRNDLFYVTRDRRIKNKINDLTKFTIFPDYNVRKIDVDLKRQYAKNNLNIIGGIKDQFEENKKIDLKEQQAKLEAFQYNNEIPHPELEEDIDIEHLL